MTIPLCDYMEHVPLVSRKCGWLAVALRRVGISPVQHREFGDEGPEGLLLREKAEIEELLREARRLLGEKRHFASLPLAPPRLPCGRGR